VVERLPTKRKALGSVPSSKKKKKKNQKKKKKESAWHSEESRAMHNPLVPATLEADTRKSQVQGQPGLPIETSF